MKENFNADEINLIELAQQYSDDHTARELLEKLRWPNGPICPHCKNDGKAKSIYRLKAKWTSKAPAREGVCKCGACRKQFTVTVGTVFEASHIPISKWLMAIFILCSSKKSVSSHQLHRMLKITYKTAWFMSHRIRYAMGSDDVLAKLLTGTVEVDETYVGGKGDPKTKSLRKTPVIALVERDGTMKVKVVSNVTQKNLRRVITDVVAKDATLNTDDSGVYRKQFPDYARHDIVNHSKFEYSRRNKDGTSSGINHCESFFSLLKRGVMGSWHHVSREHLQKYAGEFEFRWNTRHATDGARMVAAIERTEGKRLTYRQAI